MPHPPAILVTDWYAPDFSIEESHLSPLGWKWSMPAWSPPAPPAKEQEEDILSRIKEIPNIVGVLFLIAPITERVINALPETCIHLQRVGIGLDNVNLPAVRARGFLLDNTPEYAIEEVAVHAMAMVLSLHRQLGETQRLLIAGQWKVQPPRPIERLSTQTVGLIGLGRIGKRFAEMIRPFVSRVIFHDPYAKDIPTGVESATFDEVLQSDIVSLHCPSLPETHHIINRNSLKKMKPGALLINVSRGALVDPVALHEAVSREMIAGAALDVFEPEVLPKDSPLHELQNVILTSHTAWYSRHSIIDCRTQAITKLITAVQAHGLDV
jgi:D-3-phosphoglycerate dehydrogenase